MRGGWSGANLCLKRAVEHTQGVHWDWEGCRLTLMSRWQTPLSWHCAKPRQSCWEYTRATGAGSPRGNFSRTSNCKQRKDTIKGR